MKPIDDYLDAAVDLAEDISIDHCHADAAFILLGAAFGVMMTKKGVSKMTFISTELHPVLERFMNQMGKEIDDLIASRN